MITTQGVAPLNTTLAEGGVPRPKATPMNNKFVKAAVVLSRHIKAGFAKCDPIDDLDADELDH